MTVICNPILVVPPALDQHIHHIPISPCHQPRKRGATVDSVLMRHHLMCRCNSKGATRTHMI